MKLSDWMVKIWEGPLPFDSEAWPVNTFGPGSRPATRLRVFSALSAMASGQIGVYAGAEPYGRRGLSPGEAMTLAELRGFVGGFLAATGSPQESEWVQKAVIDEIQQSFGDRQKEISA